MINKTNFYINGEWVSPNKKNDFYVINPSNEKPFAVISLGNRLDVDNAVNYAKYPPTGKRGVGLYRASGYGLNFEEYKKWVEREMVIIAQIEHIDAVKNIDSILQVDGIDGTLIGPYDLSGSIGYPGEFERDDVKDAIQKVIDKCKEHNIPSGFHVVDTNPKKLKTKIQQGCTFLAYGIDYFFLRDSALNGMNDIIKGFKK